MAILPILAMFFMALKGFVYTIAVYIYAFSLAFSSKTHCILHHFTLRLAPKRTAFSGIYLAFSIKTHCILQQIAVHLAANSPKCGANGGFCK